MALAQSVFPPVTGRALIGEAFTVPVDLEKPGTLIIVAFYQDQQPDVDTWIPAMEALETERSDFAFYEFPTISKLNPFVRWFIYRGMRSGIKAERARARTVTLHIDKAPFKEELGIEDEDRIYAFLVDPDGSVLWRESGRYTLAKEAALRAVLEIRHES